MDCCRNVEKGQSCGLLSGVCFPPTPDEMVVYVLRAKKNNAAGSFISLFPFAQTGVHIGLRRLHTSTKFLRAWSWRRLYANRALLQDSRARTYRFSHRLCNTSLQRSIRCSSHHYNGVVRIAVVTLYACSLQPTKSLLRTVAL